jgi:hypothetical protein
MPFAAASDEASVANDVVQTVTVTTPAFSSQIESWTLHDAQLPQSPNALTTAKQRRRRSSST